MSTGQYALNKTGLSTQVPMKMVFLKNGTNKNITIGKSSIIFQPTTTKKLAMVGTISSLLFLGLEELDLNQLNELELEKIMSLLKKEDTKKLKHDLKLAPAEQVILSLRTFSIKNLTKDTKVIYLSNVGKQTKDIKWGLVEIVGIADLASDPALCKI